MEEYGEGIKKNYKFEFCKYVMILGIVGFILTNAIAMIFVAWLGFIFGALEYTKTKNKSSRPYFIAAAVLSVLPSLYFAIFLMVPVVFSSGMVWKYPFQRAYIGLYQNVDEPDWFPNFLGDVRGDYLFTYMPSIMQGDGFYDVRFKTTPQKAQNYIYQFEPRAEYVFRIDNGNIGETVSGELELKESETLTVRINREFWEKCGPNTKAYVLFDNFNWNHPHSAVVVVDPDSGKIQMSENG